MSRAGDEATPVAGRIDAPAAGEVAGTDLAVARAWVPELLAWLGDRDPDRVQRALAAAPASALGVLRHVLTTQGLGPLVADALGGHDDAAGSPAAAATAAWLAAQLAQNRIRLARFADDLGAVLSAAAAAGVAVMPMKGGILAFTRYREPGLRPMADLDLLVRPEEAAAVDRILVELGYQPVRQSVLRHRTYRRPREHVVAMDATHPDNPRPIEVHTRVLRTVWLERGPVDLAPMLWASGRASTLLGHPAIVPSDPALLIDVAWHATSHLMRGTGSLLQCHDLALLARALEHVDGGFADHAYPALALAARAFVAAGLGSRVAALRPSVARSVARFADRVPLDDRAGLNLRGVHHRQVGWLRARWRTWGPNPWLVRLAHPHLPVPLAHVAYAGGLAAYATRRVVRAARRGDPGSRG